MALPKPSIKGKWRCSFWKQYFATRDKLLKHVEAIHKKKSKNDFRCSCCYIQYDIEQECDIHMQQHMLDDRCELKAIKSQNLIEKDEFLVMNMIGQKTKIYTFVTSL